MKNNYKAWQVLMIVFVVVFQVSAGTVVFASEESLAEVPLDSQNEVSEENVLIDVIQPEENGDQLVGDLIPGDLSQEELKGNECNEEGERQEEQETEEPSGSDEDSNHNSPIEETEAEKNEGAENQISEVVTPENEVPENEVSENEVSENAAEELTASQNSREAGIQSAEVNVSASNAGNVQSKIKAICDPLVGKHYEYYYYSGGVQRAGGCQAFVMSIYEKVFGYSRWGNSYTAQRPDQTNWNNLQSYLLNNARPGDIIRFEGGTPHSMLLYSVDAGGVTVYHSSGKSTTNNIVYKNTYSYSSLISTFRDSHKCKKYFIYQMQDSIYQSVSGYNSSPDDKTPPVISNVLVQNVTGTGFDVSCVATDNVGVTSVTFPTWTVKGDQDDLVWHNGTYSGGRWGCHVNTSEHNDEDGLYVIHVYAYDAAGNSTSYAAVEANVDRSAPKISDVKVSNVTRDGYDVSCVVSDATGVSRVQFPSWTPWNNGQDDLVWHEGSYSGGRWSCRVKASEHNYEEGEYVSHVYAYDTEGNRETFGSGVSAWVDRTAPKIQSISISNKDESGYTVNAVVTDNHSIDRVQFPTYTTANGKDDLVSNWSTSNAVRGQSVGNGTFTFRVKISEHNNEFGEYNTLVYAYDGCGNSVNKSVSLTVDKKQSGGGNTPGGGNAPGSGNTPGRGDTPAETPGGTPGGQPGGTTGNASNLAAKQKTDITQFFDTTYRKYSVKPKGYASVNSKGMLTAKKSGTVTVTGYIKSGKKWIQDQTVTLVIYKPSFSVKKLFGAYPGEMIDAAKYLNGSMESPTTWTSSKASVATVDADGKITVVKNGSTKITAVYGTGKQAARYQVTLVVKTPVISKKKAVIKVGKRITLKMKNTSHSVVWSSSNEQVATVSNGVVTALSPGNAVISATIDGIDYPGCSVVVK